MAMATATAMATAAAIPCSVITMIPLSSNRVLPQWWQVVTTMATANSQHEIFLLKKHQPMATARQPQSHNNKRHVTQTPEQQSLQWRHMKIAVSNDSYF